jgi:hypothetical protein
MLRQFFDSSALIKYYHDEIGSPKVQILVGALGSEQYVARLITAISSRPYFNFS